MKKCLKYILYSVFITITFAFPQIHLSWAMDAPTPIKVTQPDGTTILMRVCLNQPLSDLRLELIKKEKMIPNDSFQLDGMDIYQGDEKDWTVRNVIRNNTLTMKSRNLNNQKRIETWNTKIHQHLYQFNLLDTSTVTIKELISVVVEMNKNYLEELKEYYEETATTYPYPEGFIEDYTNTHAYLKFTINDMTNPDTSFYEGIENDGYFLSKEDCLVYDDCVPSVWQELHKRIMGHKEYETHLYLYIYKIITGSVHPRWEKFRKKVEIEKQRTLAAEQEEIKRREDTKRREKQEKINLCNSKIMRGFQHIKNLQNYTSTYEELVRVLEAIKSDYPNAPTGLDTKYHVYTFTHLCEKYKKDIQGMHPWEKNQKHGRYIWSDFYWDKALEIMKTILKMELEDYRGLQGINHPRWNEFPGQIKYS